MTRISNSDPDPRSNHYHVKSWWTKTSTRNSQDSIQCSARAQVEVGPWAKYLQLRFLTQYGSEPVCAINDIIVHGRSAAQDLEDQLAGDDAPAAQHPAAQLPPMPTRDVSSTSVTTRGDPPEKVSLPASPDANTPPAVLESSVGPQVGETIVDTYGGDAVTLPDTAVMASENGKNVFVDRIAVMPLDASIAAPGSYVDTGNIDASENIGVIVPPLPAVNTDRAPSASTVGSPIGLAVASEQQVASDRPAAVLGAEPSAVASLPSNTAEFSNRCVLQMTVLHAPKCSSCPTQFRGSSRYNLHPCTRDTTGQALLSSA